MLVVGSNRNKRNTTALIDVNVININNYCVRISVVSCSFLDTTEKLTTFVCKESRSTRTASCVSLKQGMQTTRVLDPERESSSRLANLDYRMHRT